MIPYEAVSSPVNDTLAVNDIRVVHDILLVLVVNDTPLSLTGTTTIL
jgi:hypothetical protein